MGKTDLLSDPLWPRAAHWIVPAAEKTPSADLALLGVPASRTSITPTGAHATPAAIRDALVRYSTYSASGRTDVAELRAADLGDVDEPDGASGEARVRKAVARAEGSTLLVALGGDNSITYSVMTGLWPGKGELATVGLVRVDAHHDLRDGDTNGSHVRRLLEAGLRGANVVHLGIADFSNSAAYAKRALDSGITTIGRGEFGIGRLATRRLRARARRRRRQAGLRRHRRGCVRPLRGARVPFGSARGLLGRRDAADGLRFRSRFARARYRPHRIDATTDALDGRTVRLAALLVLEAAAGLAIRRRA